MDEQPSLKYGARAVGGINVLLYGSGYLFLREYLRLLVALVALAVAGFFFGLLGAVVCYLAVMYDSWSVAKKVHAGQRVLKKKVPLVAPVFIICTVLLLLISITPKYYFAASEEFCDYLYPASTTNNLQTTLEGWDENNRCKEKVRAGETLFASEARNEFTEPACEQYDNQLRTVCYFEKAKETKNTIYCIPTAIESSCINSLAIALENSSICDASPYPSSCKKHFDDCFNTESQPSLNCNISQDNIFSCEVFSDFSRPKERAQCFALFG